MEARNLFSQSVPLAEELRPREWSEIEGLNAIEPALLRRLKDGQGRPPNLILWGPPGCGKTTLAKLIGRTFKATFIEFSATLQGVKDVREIVAEAKKSLQPTLLFIDEIHRFTKTQQDALLPHTENGTISLIGATTENPSFSVTSALLSRSTVVVLKSLKDAEQRAILKRALEFSKRTATSEAVELMIAAASGDARRMLTLLEGALIYAPVYAELTKEIVQASLGQKNYLYDRNGEEHYNIASAFIKSLRGSDPDAALFWGFRMLESGEDPRFICRRLIIFAAEDVGNADPRALQLAVATADAFERIGFPEGRIPIAQCITYLAAAPKSNRSYVAMHSALKEIQAHPRVTVPLHIRNAPTELMKELDYGKDYQYPHDQEGAFAAGVKYLPEEVGEKIFYRPSERGLEKAIGEHLRNLRRR